MEPQKLPDPAYPARKNHVLPSPNVGKLWRTPWLWLKLWDVGNHIAWVDLARNKPTWLGQKKSFSPDGLTDRQGSLAVLNTSILGLTVLNRKVFTIFWGTTITHKPDSSCEPSMGLRHREWCTQWPRPLLWVPNTMRHPPSNGFSSKKKNNIPNISRIPGVYRFILKQIGKKCLRGPPAPWVPQPLLGVLSFRAPAGLLVGLQSYIATPR